MDTCVESGAGVACGAGARIAKHEWARRDLKMCGMALPGSLASEGAGGANYPVTALQFAANCSAPR